MNQTSSNEYVRIAAALVIGLIVGFFAHWAISPRGNSSSEMVDTNQQDMTSSTTTPSSVSLSVSDQSAGSAVMVQSVTLVNPGWVAIHDDINGKPGRILGAYLFDKGTASGTVPLLRGTIAGTKYIAVVHNDDGDYHHFNPQTDKATDVTTEFTAQ